MAVLGRTVADALFPDGENPIGRLHLMDNLTFQVIGVLTRKGASPNGEDQDETVIIPYQTNALRVSGQRFVSRIAGRRQRRGRRSSIRRRTIENLLAERHGQVDFRIFNMGAMLGPAGRAGARP